MPETDVDVHSVKRAQSMMNQDLLSVPCIKYFFERTSCFQIACPVPTRRARAILTHLLDGHALREVSWLVDIAASDHCNVIRKQLQGDN